MNKLLLCEEDMKWALSVSEKIKEKMVFVCEKTKDKIPYTTIDGTYNDLSDRRCEGGSGGDIFWWTNGFFGGLCWLLYHETKEELYKEAAVLLEKKLDPCFTAFYGIHHDAGFMWKTTACANYRLTGNEEGRKKGLHAANLLAGRWNPSGSFIRAWNDNSGPDNRGWAIIDCMMNLSLLYWASLETKDPRFSLIARMHADTAMKVFVRPDGSCNHIVEFNPESGEFLKTYGGQGYAEGSSWSRGQGWALYGFVISYQYTNKAKYLETAIKIAHNCILNIGEDGILPLDFCQPEKPEYEDSCGSCIIACGLLELAKMVDLPESEIYKNAAVKILKAIDYKRSDYSKSCDAIVQKCSAAYHDKEHHITMVYADYFYVEAIFKLLGSDFIMW